MKILVTSDLHYNIKRSVKPALEVVEKIIAQQGDVLVLLGDNAGANLEHHAECFALFDSFAGAKFFVPGNHCLWCAPEQTGVERYEKLLPAVASKYDFTMLDHNPTIIDGVGFAGSIGWYDYSLHDADLAIPLEFYKHKVSPGAANYYEEFNFLVEKYRSQLTGRHFEIGARWLDRWRINWEYSDEEFLELLLNKLERQLSGLSENCNQILTFIHHLPFAELLPDEEIPDKFKFAKAFLGSTKIGELLLKFPKVSHTFCGHSHWSIKTKVSHITAINNGSKYISKELNVLEL